MNNFVVFKYEDHRIIIVEITPCRVVDTKWTCCFKIEDIIETDRLITTWLKNIGVSNKEIKEIEDKQLIKLGIEVGRMILIRDISLAMK